MHCNVFHNATLLVIRGVRELFRLGGGASMRHDALIHYMYIDKTAYFCMGCTTVNVCVCVCVCVSNYPVTHSVDTTLTF